MGIGVSALLDATEAPGEWGPKGAIVFVQELTSNLGETSFKTWMEAETCFYVELGNEINGTKMKGRGLGSLIRKSDTKMKEINWVMVNPMTVQRRGFLIVAFDFFLGWEDMGKLGKSEETCREYTENDLG